MQRSLGAEGEEPQMGTDEWGFERGGRCCGGNALEDDLRFLGFQLFWIDAGGLFEFGEGFELADLFAMSEEGSGLRTAHAEAAFELSSGGGVDVERRHGIRRVVACEVVGNDGEIEAVTVPYPAEVNGEEPHFFRVRVTAQ